MKKKRKQRIIISFIIILLIGFRSFFGFFVVQPIGALLKGTTIVFLRAGTNLPFVSSAEGLAIKSGVDVSLLSRGVMLAKITPIIIEREVLRFGYSEFFYLRSTSGVKHEN